MQTPANYDKRLYQIRDYETLAKTKLFRHAADYYNSGANDEYSLQKQYEEYANIKLKTRVFVDPSKWVGTKTSIMGRQIESPICISSTAFQRMATTEGECDTARAAEKNQVPLVLSSWATSSMEQVGKAAPTTPKIF